MKKQLLLLTFTVTCSFASPAVNYFNNDSSLIYINTFIENGSPLNWERIGKDTILINLAYNYERVALNRATEHWHFLLNAKSGSGFTLIFKNFDEIYNGKFIQFDSTLFT